MESDVKLSIRLVDFCMHKLLFAQFGVDWGGALMRVLLGVTLFLMSDGGFAQELIVPHCPCTYTLTQEQRAVFDSALSSATFWMSVRSAAVKGTLDEQAFEQLRRNYAALGNELARQDKDAAEKKKQDERRPQ